MTFSLRRIINFGLLILIVSCVTGLGLIWTRLGELEKHYVMAEKVRKFEMSIQHVYAEGAQVTVSARTLILDPTNDRSVGNAETAMKNASQIFDELMAAVKDIGEEERYGARIKSLRELAMTDFEKQRLMMTSALNRKPEDATFVMKNQENPLWRKYRDDILKLRKEVGELADQKTAAAKEHADVQKRIVEGLSLLLITIALGIYFSATKALRRVMEYMTGLQRQVDVASGSSQSLSKTSEELSQCSQHQVAALQETVSALEQISQRASQNADQAVGMEKLSQSSENVSREGQMAVAKVSEVIQEIHRGNGEMIDEIQQTNNKIEEIVAIINDISTKTKVINDIVFQTKLLSFNASVEAARAGESGKGFAVVAEEVGNLAAMSGSAAQEISKLLDESTKKVQVIVDLSRQKLDELARSGQDKVQCGVQAVEQCGRILENVVKNAADSGVNVKNISLASTEQTRGVQEISKAMHQLDRYANQNAGASQQTFSSARQMKEQAESLQSLLNSVLVTIQGE